MAPYIWYLDIDGLMNIIDCHTVNIDFGAIPPPLTDSMDFVNPFSGFHAADNIPFIIHEMII